jgi:hypothetical protein
MRRVRAQSTGCAVPSAREATVARVLPACSRGPKRRRGRKIGLRADAIPGVFVVGKVRFGASRGFANARDAEKSARHALHYITMR